MLLEICFTDRGTGENKSEETRLPAAVGFVFGAGVGGVELAYASINVGLNIELDMSVIKYSTIFKLDITLKHSKAFYSAYF